MAKKHDPFLVREQDIISLLIFKRDGMGIGKIEAALGLSRRRRQDLKMMLMKLVNEGVLYMSKGGRFAIAEPEEENAHISTSRGISTFIKGTIRLTPAGNGFVRFSEDEDDVFIPKNERGGAMDGDTVLITKWKGHRGFEGRVEEVTARSRTRISGVLEERNRRIVFHPDDPRIVYRVKFIKRPPANAMNLAVTAKIKSYPETVRDPLTVELEQIIGEPGNLLVEVKKTLFMYDIEEEFTEEVRREAEAVGTEVKFDPKENRTDLRKLPLITIDPETARDFDDAVYVQKHDGGYKLYVAIADVSYYVKEGSYMDAEALNRSFSLYLPDRSIPMLPEELSSGICSLNPGVDRNAMVAEMDFDLSGKRIGYKIYPAIIHSHERLNYKKVARLLKGEKSDIEHRDIVFTAFELAGKLHTQRLSRGALELDLPEPKIILDDDDPLLVRNIVKSAPDEWIKKAYNLVEEAMVAANEAVGHYLESHGIPVPWRVHEKPDEEKLKLFREFAKIMGVKIPSSKSTTWFSAYLDEVKKHDASTAIFYYLLRSLKQASYSVDNVGHYALAAKTYLHFTSPIRRYPDLIVHRALRFLWKTNFEPTKEQLDFLRGETKMAAMAATEAEHKIVEIERKINDIYRAWFMRSRIGDEFIGKVVSTTTFGIFVGIEDPFVEGLIKLDWIDEDNFELDEENGILWGRTSGRSILPGDPIRVTLAKADVIAGQLSFEPSGSIFELITRKHLKRSEVDSQKKKSSSKNKSKKGTGNKNKSNRSKNSKSRRRH